MKKILFVCTGNTCRSPMCAALFNAKYSTVTSMHGFSAGLYADSSPISANAAAALEQYGIMSDENNPYLTHVSHTVCSGDIREADIVYGVSSSHAAQLKIRFPEFSEKIRSLPIEISDPYGSDVDEYRSCLDDIAVALKILFSDLQVIDSDFPVVTADDSMLEKIMEIENSSFTCPWSEKSFLEALNSKNTTVYAVKDENGHIAGFSCLLVIGSEAELLNIAVSMNHRGRGFADILMKHMISECMNKEVEAVYLEVRQSNIPAQSLYEKYGFIKLGLRRKYYTNPTEDALLMKKLIDLNQ